VPAVVRSVLKLRYLLLGGAIGGGASLAKVSKKLSSVDRYIFYMFICPDLAIYKFFLLLKIQAINTKMNLNDYSNMKNGKKAFQMQSGSKV
jgi:hypothetical protein